MEDRISIVLADGVANARLMRPEKKNAVDFQMFYALGKAAERLRDMKGLRAVVLSGEGDSFCAGIDTNVFSGKAKPVEGMAHIKDLERRTHGDANVYQWAVWGWRQIPVPVVAAIRGVAYGAGFQLALGADMRFAAPDSRLSAMEMRWGIIPDMCGIHLMRRLAREDIVREMVYTGRVLSAEEALRCGFVTRLADDPLALAQEAAKEIANKNPHAIRAAKRLLNLDADKDAKEKFIAEAIEQQELLASPNQIEAVMANMMKRAPVFVDP